MSDTKPIPNEWVQQYYQQITGGQSVDSGVVYSDATAVVSASTDNVSSLSGGAHLNSQGTVAKPARRRSGASRRTPTTLLKASTTNFRALVQQFTGCPNIATSSCRAQRGPLNLNFGLAGQDLQNDPRLCASPVAPFEYAAAYANQQNTLVYQQQQQQQQEQPRFGSSQPSVGYGDPFGSNIGDPGPNMQSTTNNLDHFVMENASLHELGESPFNKSTTGGYFF